MTCTGCPALAAGPVTSMGVCPLGIRTGTIKEQGRRVRVPIEQCQRPRTDAEVVERLEVLHDDADD